MTRQVVIGDVHGQLAKLTRVLRHAQLVDEALAWAGGDATLWFMGDFVDRGPHGVGVIELVMRLQREAMALGGAVNALLGNHDASLVAAHRFGTRTAPHTHLDFIAGWRRNGGIEADLAALRLHHIAWITALPVMVRAGDTLFAHADARFYTHYGHTVNDVNTAIATLLRGDDQHAWNQLFDDFSEHRAFAGFRGDRRAETFLHTFGCRHFIHGHTPISKVTRQKPDDVTEPLIYARQRCVNVDGGMYLGGPGFAYTLPETISTH